MTSLYHNLSSVILGIHLSCRQDVILDIQSMKKLRQRALISQRKTKQSQRKPYNELPVFKVNNQYSDSSLYLQDLFICLLPEKRKQNSVPTRAQVSSLKLSLQW